MPAFPDRPYDVHIPARCVASDIFPVILAMHGGGGNSGGMARLTCPDGDVASPKCLNALAEQSGFVVVYPNGTSSPLLPAVRTFNAGGGSDGYACISGEACHNGVDEVAYFAALLEDLPAVVNIQTDRVFAVGISNGGAMSHRLACQLSDKIAAIASVGAADQYAATAECSPVRPVSVMQIHGDLDAFWPFAGGVGTGMDGNAVAASVSIDGWLAKDGCSSTPQISLLPDLDASDGTHTEEYLYSECASGAQVILLKVIGGGHTWPLGYSSWAGFGTVSHDFSANEVMLAFFSSH
jgi:polyhydroxybutyrate depolymerase